MNQLPSRLLVIAAFVVGGSGAARAETVVVRGVELRIPTDWAAKEKGPITLLGPKKHKGRAIEVIRLDAMPPATPEAFKSLLGSEKLELVGVKQGTREGARVIAASGKVVAKQGAVDVDILVVPVKDKAAMLISFVGADQDPVVKQANIEILKTARIPGPRITVTYSAPKTGLVPPPKAVVEGLSKIAEAFDTHRRLPSPLAITFEDCGVVNAHYNKSKQMIQMCHDLYDDFLKLFAKAGMDQKQVAETAAGAFMFTFLHELGHALVGELELPITGKGEDAADEIATLILSQRAKSSQIARAGATWFEVKAKTPGHKDAYWSSHSFDRVRYEAILCLMYGSDKKTHAPMMEQLKVRKDKLAKCERDTPLRLAAWKKMMQPYAVRK